MKNQRDIKREYIRQNRIEKVHRQRKNFIIWCIIIVSLIVSTFVSFASNAQEEIVGKMISPINTYDIGYFNDDNKSNLLNNIDDDIRNKSYNRLLINSIDLIVTNNKEALSSDIAKSKGDLEPTYASICIQIHDTLWDIANNIAEDSIYSTNEIINIIIKVNGLTNQIINENNYIIVPVFS